MIVALKGGQDAQLRAFSQSMSNPPTRSSGFTAGVPVTPETVGGVPAFTRAVRIAAEAVASLRLRVWRGDGFDRVAVDSVWQARLFRGAVSESQTRFQFWETIEESLSKRGNAYVWKSVDPDTGRATRLVALHPDQVLPVWTTPGELTYHVVVTAGFVDPTGSGYGFYTVGADTILHIRGHGDGGQLVAPSPIQVYRDALGVGVAKLRYESRLYRRSTAIRLAVEYGDQMTVEKAREWRDLWRETYESGDGESTAVLGGGGTLKPIGMTMSDTQFIESQNFTVAECARIVGVPASMLDSGTGKSESSPITPEHEMTRWLRYGLGPRLERIESAVLADPNLFMPNSGTYPAFDTQKFIRGDLATEADIALKKVQSGQWLVDEARELDGMGPLPNGAGQIPQVVPVGGQQNPVPTVAPAAATPVSAA